MNKNLKAALYYAEMGFSVIPVIKPTPDESGKDIKKPAVKWTEFQKTKPTTDQLKEWFSDESLRIGIVTGKLSGISVIDCDTPEAIETIESLLPENFLCPISTTPRGGRHYYFQYDERFPQKAAISEGIDCRSEGGFIMVPPSSGINGTGYTWLNGLKINEVLPAPAPLSLINYINNNSINSFYAHTGDNGNSKTGSTVVKNSKLIFTEGGRDQTIFHIANCLVKGSMHESEIKELLTLIGTNLCLPPFPEKDILAKIDSAFKRSNMRFDSIADGVRDFISVNSGQFSVNDVEKWVNISKSQSNKPILMELGKQVKEGNIERLQKHGSYRIIDNTYEPVMFDDIEVGKRLEVRLPFGLERYVEIMPKDLIVFAGVPNAGKSAIMMETAGLNQSLADCWYFSSEMGRVNWKKRLQKYEGSAVWKYKFVDDFPNFIDVIKPDGFNFIDYVEVPDGEFYKIPSILASIQKQLKNGIAFVALQKNPEKEYGVGGHQTLAKPALFCTIDPDYPGAILKVVKAKNYISENPNGFFIKFKIRNGINLLPSGVWMPELEK